MTGRVADGATQPEVEAVSRFAASCRNTSRQTGSVGLLSNGREKRAIGSPMTFVRGTGAVGDSKKEQQLLSVFHTHKPIAKHVIIPTAKYIKMPTAMNTCLLQG